jgi:hypothetical protein
MTKEVQKEEATGELLFLSQSLGTKLPNMEDILCA